MYILIGFTILVYIGLYCLCFISKNSDENAELMYNQSKKEKGINDDNDNDK